MKTREQVVHKAQTLLEQTRHEESIFRFRERGRENGDFRVVAEDGSFYCCCKGNWERQCMLGRLDAITPCENTAAIHVFFFVHCLALCVPVI